jgi:N-acetylglutamate synthase-like GNAT family acetyltransferase
MTQAMRWRIRVALIDECAVLVALMRRASLAHARYRDALLAHPDAIDVPPDQIARGDVFVGEREGRVLGFSALAAGNEGGIELDGLFVDPPLWRRGIGRELVERAALRLRRPLLLSPHRQDR